jgi:hypothetical protein
MKANQEKVEAIAEHQYLKVPTKWGRSGNYQSTRAAIYGPAIGYGILQLTEKVNQGYVEQAVLNM